MSAWFRAGLTKFVCSNAMLNKLSVQTTSALLPVSHFHEFALVCGHMGEGDFFLTSYKRYVFKI